MISDYDNRCGRDNLARAGIAPHPLLDPWVQWALLSAKNGLFNMHSPTQDEWEKRCKYQSEIVEALESPHTTREAGEALLRAFNRRIRDGALPSWPYRIPAKYEC